MSSKKAHFKSRNGCVNCKTRKVKCDERRPTCSTCHRRQTECVYVGGRKRTGQIDFLSASQEFDSTLAETSTLTPSPIRSPSLCYSAKELLNLRLLHHYTTATVECFVKSLNLGDRALNALQKDIPRLAFEQEFLLDTLLAVATIHIGCTDRNPPDFLPITLYRDQAIRTLRQAVANLSDDNRRSVMVASLLLASTSFAADRVTKHTGLWTTNWLALAMGPQIFATPAEVSIRRENPYRTPPTAHALGHFVDHPAPAAIPMGLASLLRIQKDDEDWAHRGILCDVAASIGRLIGGLNLPDHRFWMQLKVKAWPFTIPASQFLDLVHRERPRALIILGYFLVFLAYLPDVWLYEGTARQDMEKLGKMLPLPWRCHLEVPKAALQIQGKASLRAFLLAQLPADALLDETSFRPFFTPAR